MTKFNILWGLRLFYSHASIILMIGLESGKNLKKAAFATSYFIFYFALFRDDVWGFFLRRCAANLHVVLCMSPSGEALRNRCRNFPGLVGSTSIDWVFPWPEQALFAVVRRFLQEHPSIPFMHKDNIVSHVVYVHTTVSFYTMQFLLKLRRKNFVTPKHYLDFIHTYLKLVGKFCFHKIYGKKISNFTVKN